MSDASYSNAVPKNAKEPAFPYISAILAHIPNHIHCSIETSKENECYTIELTDGRPNVDVTLQFSTLAKLTTILSAIDENIKKIGDIPNIDSVSGDDVIRAIAMYQIIYKLEEIQNKQHSNVLADSILAANINCTVYVANEALAYYADVEEAIEYGVSARTGWLTEDGEKRLALLNSKLYTDYIASRSEEIFTQNEIGEQLNAAR